MSPLLANICLPPVDVVLHQAGYKSVRDADDVVVLRGSREEAEDTVGLLRATMAARKPVLHPAKSRIANAHDEGFDVLGYHFQGGVAGCGRRASRSTGRDSTSQPIGLSPWPKPIRPPFSPDEGPPTGEPDAGSPFVRFAGRGGRTQSAVTTPIGRPCAGRAGVRCLSWLRGG